MTLKKIQELNMPITNTQDKGLATPHPCYSVFESDVDNTSASAADENPRNERWKVSGPSIYGILEGEFEEYLEQMKPRRDEFHAFLREHYTQKRRSEALQLAAEEGRREEELETTDHEPTTQEFENYVLQLRQGFNLGSELTRLLCKFLDIPPPPTSHRLGTTVGDRSIPPKTHPSAGVSYLRSNAYLDNHPVLGPQARRAPVEARILFSARLDGTGMVGVAGIVANGPSTSQRERSTVQTVEEEEQERLTRGNTTNATSSIGMNTPGGNRIWVEPRSMNIDPSGRIKLDVINADQTAISIKTGAVMTNIPATRPAVQPLFASKGA